MEHWKHESSSNFLSAQRSPDAVIRRQRKIFDDLPFFKDLANAVSDILIVLNSNRQIVAANENLLDKFGLEEEDIYGLRPGELLNCVYAYNDTGGCGTSEFCKMCGAANAISKSLTEKHAGVSECRIRRKKNTGSLDLLIKTTPCRFDGEDFSIFVVADISHEKRRKALERIFFHDILNLAGNVMNLADMIENGIPEKRNRYLELLHSSTGMLIDEIVAQKQLVAAENDDLIVNFKPVDSLAVVREVAELYLHHKTAKGKNLVVDDRSESVGFVSDKTLLIRVLGNMVKNALEASEPDQAVMVGCERINGSVAFRVSNQTSMSREVRLQVFQRSFSTKSGDRGLGTYSMKLLGEKYLKGTVSFVSDRENGTVFRACFPLDPNQGTIQHR
jgi:PAS domain-containing protein